MHVARPVLILATLLIGIAIVRTRASTPKGMDPTKAGIVTRGYGGTSGGAHDGFGHGSNPY